MIKRKYGRDDEISVIGFGGIIVKDETSDNSARFVAEAVDRGVNYFDVAPQYGNAQEMLGPALEPYRKSSFLACKTLMRNAAGAEKDLSESLKLLKTDYFDLYQFHSVTTSEDVETILAPGGALETVVRARDAGKIRHIGFSAHTEEAAVRMMNGFEFDSVLFPLNWVNWYKGEFGPRVVEKASQKGVTVLALKSLAKRKWKDDETREWSKTWYRPAESFDEAALGVRFTLSIPVTAAVSPGHMELFRWACDAADDFAPLTDEEKSHLEKLSGELDPIFSVHESRWE